MKYLLCYNKNYFCLILCSETVYSIRQTKIHLQWIITCSKGNWAISMEAHSATINSNTIIWAHEAFTCIGDNPSTPTSSTSNTRSLSCRSVLCQKGNWCILRSLVIIIMIYVSKLVFTRHWVITHIKLLHYYEHKPLGIMSIADVA